MLPVLVSGHAVEMEQTDDIAIFPRWLLTFYTRWGNIPHIASISKEVSCGDVREMITWSSPVDCQYFTPTKDFQQNIARQGPVIQSFTA